MVKVMICGRRAAVFAAAAFLCLAGCGDGGAMPVATGNAPVAAGTGAEITGNLAAARGPEETSLLVFAYPKQADPVAAEPLGIGAVDAGGGFTLSGLDGQALTIVFLDDAASDGVIDPGDAIAVLGDPNHQIEGLPAGGRVVLADVRLDFDQKRAVAATIEVIRPTGVPRQTTRTPG